MATLSSTALLVIDMQLGNFLGDNPIKNGGELLNRVGFLIAKARAANVPILYIMNCGSEGDPDEPGTKGWEVHPKVAPPEINHIVEKTTPDAFHETNLKQELDEMNVTRLIVAGLQTEYCIDTTCRRGSLLGYDVVLVSDAHSTWDSELFSAEDIITHHNSVLAGWFVSLSRTDEINFR
ncbi:MAG: cysteine hydrolase family protein [Candidatus Hodarchaeota archaeon]